MGLGGEDGALSPERYQQVVGMASQVARQHGFHVRVRAEGELVYITYLLPEDAEQRYTTLLLSAQLGAVAPNVLAYYLRVQLSTAAAAARALRAAA